MNKLIIYGDIHGCYDEFISLRNQINPQRNDMEVCVGDIITKGKNSIKTLDFIIENNIKSVLGNHEDKLLRYLNHQKTGEYLTYGQENENSTFWADIYDGKHGFIIYGHQWFSKIKKSNFALGIDTGCVYGKKLTAVYFTDVKKINSYSFFDILSKNNCTNIFKQ